MENAAEAIYMASAMLLFLIALSVAMFSVSNLRQGADAVFAQTETMEMSQVDQKYVNYIRNSKSTRIVDSATVISSMMRSSKENYAVYIKFNDTTSIPNKGTERNQIVITKAYSDLTIGTNTYIHAGDDLVEFSVGDKRYGVNQESEEILRNDFFEFIKDKTFYEYLGVYQNNSGAPSENKVTYRIITYVEK